MIGFHMLNSLSESISVIDQFDDKEEIDYELSTFFRRLMKRKRTNDIETGLQAGGVIYPDKAGFKISERDGQASHAQAQENVSQYLNGESSFSSEETVGMIGTRKNDPNSWPNIKKKGFIVRIVATDDSLLFNFQTDSYQANRFQIEIIYELFSYIKRAYEQGLIKYPYVNYVTGKDKVVFQQNYDLFEYMEKLDNLLSSKIEIAKEKTR